MFAHSVYVTVVAPWSRVTVRHARDVAAPWDEAIGDSQPHLHDRQRNERCRSDLVHPASDAFGSFVGIAGRAADFAIAALAALHRSAHRSRRSPSPDRKSTRLNSSHLG